MAPELAFLLLGDGRFPAGGHAHSAGVEAAVADGRIGDLDGLASFARERLRTAGLVDAALAAATAVRLGSGGEPAEAVLRRLDGEADARMVAPPTRTASRRQGRQLVRVASRCWPDPVLAAAGLAAPEGLHLAVATGAVAVAAGLDGPGAARLVVHATIAAPAGAAVKLLGLDPFAVAALWAELGPEAERAAADAVARAAGPIEDLPSATSPLHEIAAVEHAARDLRLFVT
ncbi:MAG: urease accessory protein UreF [Acidimicrobiia bacterium]